MFEALNLRLIARVSLPVLLSALGLLAIDLQNSCAEVGVAADQIVIGTANTLSGPSAFVGKEMNIGFNAYIQYVNDHGGINGRKIKVVSCDDRYEQDGAIQCFKKLTEDGVFGITGCYGAALMAKYLPMAMNEKIPMVGFSSGPAFAADPVKRYVFTIRPDFTKEEMQVVDKLWNDGHFRKFAVVYQNDAYGNAILTGVSNMLKTHNADVVATGSYTRNLNNLDQAFALVKKANPEVVILGAVQVPCAEFAKMAHKANWHPLLVINSGSAVDDYLTLAGKDADGTLVTEVSPSFVHSSLPAVKLYEELLKKYYPDEKPNFTSLRGYNNAMLWVEALKRTGKDLTREKFVDTLDSMRDWDQGLGKSMEVSFSPSNHVGRSNLFYCMVKGNEVVGFSEWNRLKK
jgi:ABC-type branched-subunit amino acid transport system substrate-binding protein